MALDEGDLMKTFVTLEELNNGKVPEEVVGSANVRRNPAKRNVKGVDRHESEENVSAVTVETVIETEKENADVKETANEKENDLNATIAQKKVNVKIGSAEKSMMLIRASERKEKNVVHENVVVEMMTMSASEEKGVDANVVRGNVSANVEKEGENEVNVKVNVNPESVSVNAAKRNVAKKEELKIVAMLTANVRENASGKGIVSRAMKENYRLMTNQWILPPETR